MDKITRREALPPMQNPVREAILLLAALLKSGNHTLNDLFKKQVSNTLIQRVPECKFDIE